MREMDLANGDIDIYKKNGKWFCEIENAIFYYNIKNIKQNYEFFKKSIISELDLVDDEKCEKVKFKIEFFNKFYILSLDTFEISSYQDLLHKINYVIKEIKNKEIIIY